MHRYNRYRRKSTFNSSLFSVPEGARARQARYYDWKEGDKVVHKLWGHGCGKCLISGEGKSMTLKLQFPGQGSPSYEVAFAPIEKEE